MIELLQKIRDGEEAGQDFTTCSEHLVNISKLDPTAVMCIAAVGQQFSCAVHGTEDEMARLWTVIAAMPHLQPYVCFAYELIREDLNMPDMPRMKRAERRRNKRR